MRPKLCPCQTKSGTWDSHNFPILFTKYLFLTRQIYNQIQCFLLIYPVTITLSFLLIRTPVCLTFYKLDYLMLPPSLAPRYKNFRIECRWFWLQKKLESMFSQYHNYTSSSNDKIVIWVWYPKLLPNENQLTLTYMMK